MEPSEEMILLMRYKRWADTELMRTARALPRWNTSASPRGTEDVGLAVRTGSPSSLSRSATRRPDAEEFVSSL